MLYPGPPKVGHQWGYLPDVAETMVQLVEREAALPVCGSYHAGGHWDSDGSRLIDAVKHTTGQPHLKVRPFPWWLISLASPFSEMCRELREMRYLWQVPARLDDAALREILDHVPFTPWEEAVRATLDAKGCLAGS
jgi:nucleoside-diphosphate-sugar epimerase